MKVDLGAGTGLNSQTFTGFTSTDPFMKLNTVYNLDFHRASFFVNDMYFFDFYMGDVWDSKLFKTSTVCTTSYANDKVYFEFET